MKIRAKLKDVVILPEDEYELAEIKRLTEYVKDDPEAVLKMGFMGTNWNLELTYFRVEGKVPNFE